MMPARQDPVPSLTDRAALSRNRTRADRIGFVDFLHRIAADEIQDRLREVNRSFTDIAVVTGHPKFWARAFPAARILADDPRIDLAPQSQDLVIHAMALHWAEDPVGQIAQSARALRPDGLFIAACPGGRSLAELRDVMTRAEAEVSGGLSPRVLPMGEIRDLGGLLSRVGLALPVADQIGQRVSYRSLFHLAQDLRAMGEGNALAARLRRPTRRAVLMHAARLYAQNHPDPQDSDRILASFELVFLTGWAPDASQPKPLRPGSARMPLADALASMRQQNDPT
ncbi:MAG: methyltransferase domain-containing protein [Paracoccus sp. (in: a-proteobacteria)]|uniref:methyltransferase domain-containing protein n=1 Tax=Paracoccus sp. TaxID=267 RepID=UPI0039E61BAD